MTRAAVSRHLRTLGPIPAVLGREVRLGGRSFIESRVGGDAQFELPADGITAHGTVRSFDPPRVGFGVALVEHTFVDDAAPAVTSVCRWAVIHNLDGGCDLHFTHDGFGEALRRRRQDGAGPEPLSQAPDQGDLVHIDIGHAFDEYVELAARLGAATVWYHSPAPGPRSRPTTGEPGSLPNSPPGSARSSKRLA